MCHVRKLDTSKTGRRLHSPSGWPGPADRWEEGRVHVYGRCACVCVCVCSCTCGVCACACDVKERAAARRTSPHSCAVAGGGPSAVKEGKQACGFEGLFWGKVQGGGGGNGRERKGFEQDFLGPIASANFLVGGNILASLGTDRAE